MISVQSHFGESITVIGVVCTQRVPVCRTLCNNHLWFCLVLLSEFDSRSLSDLRTHADQLHRRHAGIDPQVKCRSCLCTPNRLSVDFTRWIYRSGNIAAPNRHLLGLPARFNVPVDIHQSFGVSSATGFELFVSVNYLKSTCSGRWVRSTQ